MTDRRAFAIAAALCVVAHGAVAQESTGAGPAAVSPPTAMEGPMAVSDSEQELRRKVALAGQPTAVRWAVQRLGPKNPDSFPPGPSDYTLLAVLTYASKDEVAAILGDGLTEQIQLTTPDWFPAGLTPGQVTTLTRHYKVEGFMDAIILTSPDAPGTIILQKSSS